MYSIGNEQFYRNQNLPVGYGAVVVIYDTTAFEWRTKSTFLRMLALRLLLSTVCVEKYIPNLFSENMTVSNIVVWQVNSDMRKYYQK